MNCRGCGRPIRNIRSVTNGRGPCCQKRHLATLPEKQKQNALTIGYQFGRWDCETRFIVTSPEHNAYCVDLEELTCTCEAWHRSFVKRPETATCKHISFVKLGIEQEERERQEAEAERLRRQQEKAEQSRRRAERQAARRERQAAALDLEIARDFN